MANKILVTSALPYANGALHFGHIAGAYLGADCYARFERMQGSDVLYVCGSDEYGFAITLSAEQAGRTPEAHADHYHNIIQALFERLNFSFDNYSRTTWPGHKEQVQQYFNDLKENGYVEEKETEQLYSEEEKRFLADRYVVGTCPHCSHEDARGDECTKCGQSYEATDLILPRSKLTNSPLTLKVTSHWFLRLDKFKTRLEKWLKDKTWKPGVLHFAEHYVDKLRPRAITRDGTWGIPVAEGKVFYVWFEACIGYLSASIQARPDTWRDYWCDPKTKLVQFLGKDNIFFHAIFFPAMTMGQNQPYKLVDDLPANEFLNLEGKQFSKSEGWTIDFTEFLNRYTADQARYALAANAPETSDSEFTWHDFQTRCNSELVGKYGNLVNRVLVFTQKQAGGKIPSDPDLEFLAQVDAIKTRAKEAYASYSVRKATHAIVELAQLGNTYFDHKQPWKSEDKEKTIASCLECLKTLAIISAPIIPETAQRLWDLLGQTTPLTSWDQPPLKPNTPLPPPEILFAKVEDDTIAQEIANLKK